MRVVPLAAALFLPIAAYAGETPTPAKSISWYMAHPAELAATMSVCRDNTQFGITFTCQNVEAAANAVHAHLGPDLRSMMMDPRYWSANPIAREGLLVQCRIGTALEPRFCKPAAQSAMAEIQQAVKK